MITLRYHEEQFPGTPDLGLMIEIYERAPMQTRVILLQTCKKWQMVARQRAAQYEYIEDAARAGCDASFNILLGNRTLCPSLARSMISVNTSTAFIATFCGKDTCYRDRRRRLSLYAYLSTRGKKWIEEMIFRGFLKADVMLDAIARGRPNSLRNLGLRSRRWGQIAVAIANDHGDKIGEISSRMCYDLLNNIPHLIPKHIMMKVIAGLQQQHGFYPCLFPEAVIPWLDADTASVLADVKRNLKQPSNAVYVKDPIVFDILSHTGFIVWGEHTYPHDIKTLLSCIYRGSRSPALVKTILATCHKLTWGHYDQHIIPVAILQPVRDYLVARGCTLVEVNPHEYRLVQN